MDGARIPKISFITFYFYFYSYVLLIIIIIRFCYLRVCKVNYYDYYSIEKKVHMYYYT